MPEKPSLTTLIHGGLGNQLFCYAAARGMATRWGRECFIDTSTGYQRDRYDRSYRLSHFPIRAKIADQSLSLGGNSHSLAHRWQRIISRYQSLESRRYHAEKNSFTHGSDEFTSQHLFELHPITTKPIYLNGYWQDFALFHHIEAEIRTELTPPAPTTPAAIELLAKISATPNATFLHIRRERYYPEMLLPHSYYENRISQCLARFPDAHFFVFGDDFPWAREINFHGAPVTFCERIGSNEIEDLALMTAAQHAIPAPSTFSWWATWLGKKPNQAVWLPPFYGLSYQATPAPDRVDDTAAFYLENLLESPPAP